MATAIVFLYFTITEIRNYKMEIANSILKNMLKFSMRLLPANIAGWILTLSDRYFINYYKGYAQTGIYQLGYQFGMLINPVFITPFIYSFTVYKFDVYKDSDAREKFKLLFRRYNILCCLILLGLSLFSKFGITILSNKDFINAYKIVPSIAYSYFLYGKVGYYVLGLQIKIKTYKEGIYMILSAFLNIILNLVFVPKMGMMGAAMATIIAYLVLNIMLVIASQKEYKIDLDLKYNFNIQFITLILYLIYYFVTIKNISIEYEFAMSYLIIVFYFIIILKFKYMSKGELKDIIIAIFRRKYKDTYNL